MDLTRIDAQCDVKRLAQHLNVTKLVQFAYISSTFEGICEVRTYKELYVVKSGDKIFLWQDSNKSWFCAYDPDYVLHDGPITCHRLTIVGNCRVPPEAIRFKKLLIEILPETIPLINHKITSLMIYSISRTPSFYITLTEFLQMLGPNLEELQLQLVSFPDGAHFVDRITTFRARWPEQKLRVLSIMLMSVNEVLSCVQQNIDFIRHNDFLETMIVSLKPFQVLTEEELNCVKLLLEKYFTFVEDYQPTDRKILFHHAPSTWMNFVIPLNSSLENNSESNSVAEIAEEFEYEQHLDEINDELQTENAAEQQITTESNAIQALDEIVGHEVQPIPLLTWYLYHGLIFCLWISLCIVALLRNLMKLR